MNTYRIWSTHYAALFHTLCACFVEYTTESERHGDTRTDNTQREKEKSNKIEREK